MRIFFVGIISWRFLRNLGEFIIEINSFNFEI